MMENRKASLRLNGRNGIRSERYNSADIMRVIGKQSTGAWYDHAEEIEVIMNAPCRSMTAIMMDMFAFGIICGKQEERAKVRA